MIDNNKDVKFDINDTFEEKVILNLLQDNEFLQKVAKILKPEYFSSYKHQWIVEVIKKYHSNYSKAPTYDSFIIQMKDDFRNSDDEEEEQTVKSILSVLIKLFKKPKYIKEFLKDRERVQEFTSTFCWQEEMKNSFLKCADYIQRGEYDKILPTIEIAHHSADNRDDGIDYDDVESRLNEEFRLNIKPFPWDAVNDRIGGGIGDGEFFVTVGPMGSGKSLLASTVALYSKKSGNNCVLFSLELNKRYVRHRTDVIMTGVSSEELIEMKKNEPDKYKELINEKIKSYNDGKLIIINIPAGSSAVELISSLKLLKAEGYDPNMFVVDYLDLMEPIDPRDKSKKDWEKFEVITRECRDNVARALDISGFGLVQGNTNSMKQSVITAENTGGGARRLHPADVVWGWARNTQDKQLGRANLSFIKSRFGEDGFVLPAKTDYNIGKIELLDKPFHHNDEDQTLDDGEVKDRLRDRVRDFSERRKNPHLKDLDEIID